MCSSSVLTELRIAGFVVSSHLGLWRSTPSLPFASRSATGAVSSPLDNFYERKKTPTGKQPYAIGLRGGRLMAMAGLWETWRSPQRERIRSFTIATPTPNELYAELHNRMPVVLKTEVWPM
jgi:hypothetical protein